MVGGYVTLYMHIVELDCYRSGRESVGWFKDTGPASDPRAAVLVPVGHIRSFVGFPKDYPNVKVIVEAKEAPAHA
jgi:hypothetical protein